MKDNNAAACSGGARFCGALALIFITLKLTGYIAWPWVWVLAPIWIPLLAMVAFALAVALITAIFCR